MLLEPVKRLVGIHNIFEQALGASQKVFEYLDHTEEIVREAGCRKLTGFRQSHRLRQRLLPLSRRAERIPRRGTRSRSESRRSGGAGGPQRRRKNHAGQPRAALLRCTGGAVKVDGHDVRDLDLASLRAQIGIVAQDTFLFNDTVANNIAYGRPGTRWRRSAAARERRWPRIIERLPEGYETIIGDRGIKSQRRPAAAHRHRPRAAEECADPDSGRSYLAPGYRI